MAAELAASFPATMPGMGSALKSAEDFCKERNIAPDLTSRVRIVIEELFSNTIKYGYGGECDRPVRLRLCADPILTLIYEDDARPFDPTASQRTHPVTAPDNRPVGKTGLTIVMGLCTAVIYRPRLDGNRVEMIF